MNRLARRTVYVGRKLSLHIDRFTNPSGGEHEREVVEHVATAVMIPVDAGEVLMVRQHRYAIGRSLLEIPAGTVDPGEQIEHCAIRELREETGYSASSLTPLGRYYTSPGYCTEIMAFFLATGLTPDPAPPDDDEQIELVRIPLDEAVRRAREGEFEDLKTVAGLLLLEGHG